MEPRPSPSGPTGRCRRRSQMKTVSGFAESSTIALTGLPARAPRKSCSSSYRVGRSEHVVVGELAKPLGEK